MKKSVIIILALMATMLGSCKKDYATSPLVDEYDTPTVEVSTIPNSIKTHVENTFTVKTGNPDGYEYETVIKLTYAPGQGVTIPAGQIGYATINEAEHIMTDIAKEITASYTATKTENYEIKYQMMYPGTLTVEIHSWNSQKDAPVYNKMIYVLENEPPEIDANISVDTTVHPYKVTIDLSGSVDPDGEIERYIIDVTPPAVEGGNAADNIFFEKDVQKYKPGGVSTRPNSIETTDEIVTLYYELSGTYLITIQAVDNTDNVGELTTTFNIGNSPPTAVIDVGNTSGVEPFTVTFDGTKSTDQDGNIKSYTWNFGDGTPQGSGSIVQHTFNANGESTANYNVQLTVTDNNNATATATKQITVQPKGETAASYQIQNMPSTCYAGTQIILDGTGSVAANGETITSYEWYATLSGSSKVKIGEGSIYNYTVNFIGTGALTLVVTDSKGDTDETSKTVTIKNKTPIVELTANPNQGDVPLTVSFLANVTDPDKTITDLFGQPLDSGTYSWSVDGAAYSQGTDQYSHTFTTAAAHNVKVKYVDSYGAQDIEEITINSSNPIVDPLPVINMIEPYSTANPINVATHPKTITLNAAGSTNPNGTPCEYSYYITPYRYQAFDPSSPDFTLIGTSTTSTQQMNRQILNPGEYRVWLTMKDITHNREATVYRDINIINNYPEITNITVGGETVTLNQTVNIHTRKATVVQFTAVDPDAVDTVEYRLYIRPFAYYSGNSYPVGNWPINTDYSSKTYTIELYAKDNYGSFEDLDAEYITKGRVYVNAYDTAPTASFEMLDKATMTKIPSGSNISAPINIRINVSADDVDEPDEIIKYEYKLDSEEWYDNGTIPYKDYTFGAGEATHTFQVRATSTGGRTVTTTTQVVNIVNTPPTIGSKSVVVKPVNSYPAKIDIGFIPSDLESTGINELTYAVSLIKQPEGTIYAGVINGYCTSGILTAFTLDMNNYDPLRVGYECLQVRIEVADPSLEKVTSVTDVSIPEVPELNVYQGGSSITSTTLDPNGVSTVTMKAEALSAWMDNVYDGYKWYINGTLVGETSIGNGNTYEYDITSDFIGNNTVKVELVTSSGRVVSYNTTSLEVLPGTPAVSLSKTQTNPNGHPNTITYTITATNPNNTAIKYQYSWNNGDTWTPLTDYNNPVEAAQTIDEMTTGTFIAKIVDQTYSKQNTAQDAYQVKNNTPTFSVVLEKEVNGGTRQGVGTYSTSQVIQENPGVTSVVYYANIINAQDPDGDTIDISHPVEFTWELPDPKNSSTDMTLTFWVEDEFGARKTITIRTYLSDV